MSTVGRLRTPARWRSAPVPNGFGSGDSVARTGRLVLPLRLDWSPGGQARDLSDATERRRVYELVLTSGTADDVKTYIDPVLLVEEWAMLRLPTAVRETWQPWIDAQT